MRQDCQFATRHGLVLVQERNCAAAQALVLSLWQLVHGFGMPEVSVSVGERKRKVWLATKVSPCCLLGRVWAMLGMWHAMHWLPGLFAGWLLVFVPVIKELSASILLFSSSSITLAVAVYNLYETGYIEPVAALAIVNMIIIGLAILVANKLGGGKIASRSGVSQGLAS